jgi:hypothetical protein
MTLEEFEKQLAELLGRPTDLSPFVCDGSPLECQIFLVGFNPAAEMDTDFWAFWQPGRGYDKAAWYSRYKTDRAARPLKRGKGLAVTPTRRNIDAFLEGAGSVRVLETNIYSGPSTDMRNLDVGGRESAPFHFLLEAIRPKVVVTHGREANDLMSRLYFGGRVMPFQHFSRGVSRDAARALGEQAARACLAS